MEKWKKYYVVIGLLFVVVIAGHTFYTRYKAIKEIEDSDFVFGYYDRGYEMFYIKGNEITKNSNFSDDDLDKIDGFDSIDYDRCNVNIDSYNVARVSCDNYLNNEKARNVYYQFVKDYNIVDSAENYIYIYYFEENPYSFVSYHNYHTKDNIIALYNGTTKIEGSKIKEMPYYFYMNTSKE